MTEEKPAGYLTETLEDGTEKIISMGIDPWIVRKYSGKIRFKGPDAAKLKVTPLDQNGIALEQYGTAKEIELLPEAAYYHIHR